MMRILGTITAAYRKSGPLRRTRDPLSGTRDPRQQYDQVGPGNRVGR